MMPEENEIVEASKEILENLLELMGIKASVEPSLEPAAEGEEQSSPSITLDIEGEDLGILIGWHGQTLASLQYMVRLITGCKLDNQLPIVVDVKGYKRRRHEALQALALRIAEQVTIKRTPFTLEPMPAYERRVIHLTLANHPNVTTESTGYGDARKVIVIPKKLI